MTREEFIDKLAKLTYDYEESCNDPNDVTVKLEFFDGSKYVWNGEKLICIRD